MSDDKENAILIASIPPVVYTILDNLPAIHLNKCAQVCTLWRDIVNSIKRRRRRFSWFFYYYCSRETFLYYAPFYCRGRNPNCLDSFYQHLNSLSSEPSMVLVFCTKPMVHQSNYFYSSFPVGKQRMHKGAAFEALQYEVSLDEVVGTIYPSFPRNCEVGICTARGVTGTSTYTSLIPKPKKISFCPSLSILSFPNLPGVNIYRFPLSSLQCTAPLTHTSLTGIPSNVTIKCLLVFVYDRIGDFHYLPCNKFIGHYLGKQNWKMALGGAYIDCMSFPKHQPSQSIQCYGIAFTGENVEAASIVLTRYMNSEEQIMEQFKLIIESDLLKGQCIAFMFTSKERESIYFKGSDKINIFCRLFPDIPLFVVSCGGEIGINYVPNRESKQGHDECSWVQSYASVFVVISVRV